MIAVITTNVPPVVRTSKSKWSVKYFPGSASLVCAVAPLRAVLFVHQLGIFQIASRQIK